MQHLSVDEGMIRYKGRLFFRKYMPRKPVKWGIKVWMAAEANTAFTLGPVSYTVRHSTGQPRLVTRSHCM